MKIAAVETKWKLPTTGSFSLFGGREREEGGGEREREGEREGDLNNLMLISLYSFQKRSNVPLRVQ